MAVFALLERLAPLIEREVNLVLESKKEVENLSGKLKKIQEVLQDAERTGVTDSNVKNWLKNLQDVSYEMEDALDEWETANLQLQIEGSEEISDPWEKIISFIQSICLCFEHVVGRREISLKIKGLIGKLDLIVQGKDEFGFLPSGGHNLREFNRIESISLVDSASVRGRSIDKENLIQNLLSEGDNGVEIVSIVGTGGVGKTTLAQIAFNDPEVEKHFELKIWICVSDPFDEIKIAKSVLEAVGESSSNISNLQMLLQRVKNSVSKKRFLIVLDDVWTEDRKRWEPLKSTLQGAPGSRILMTTRSERVVRVIGTDTRQPLGQLSDDDCWSLLSKIAFVGKSKEECEKLEDIGKKIAMNCKGLPLAAKSMGSLLCFKDTVGEWLNVLESPLWQLEEATVELFPHFYLSYNDLSPVLKRCFSSCVIYPKDTLIRLDELIRLWMAHGYLGSSGNVDHMQRMGLEFFKNLEMRNFFQELENDKYDESKVSCKMHDIMHDFVTYLSKEEYTLILYGGVEITNCDIGKVRTFCARNVARKGFPLNLFSRLKCVRVLIASNCGLEEISQEIGKLIHLRYLDLSYNPIRELPETLCDLYNLQTLDLRGCHKLSALPQGIYKLINLRHLLFQIGWSMKSIPQGLERLTGLWMLSSFKAGGESSKLGYLRKLNQIRGSLELLLENLTELEDAENAELKNKIYIQELSISFREEVMVDIRGEVMVDIMKALQPPPNLHYLRMYGYEGTQFPVWITTSLNYLRVLHFQDFKKCSSLPPLRKLPMLEELQISLMWSMKYVGNEFLGITETIQELPNAGPAFPKLRRLLFSGCDNWEKWEDITGDEKDHLSIMPCLRELEISFCDKLKALPHCLLRMTSSLEYLTVESSLCLASLYGDRTGDEWDKISHIPHIKVESLEDIKRLWMAHGYLGSSGNVDHMQRMGFEFFKNIEMRSFFQESVKDKYDESKVSCKMHDIMHDFVTYLSKDEYNLILYGGVEITNCDIEKARTFCARNVSQEGLPLNLLRRLKCVRVLIASDCGLQKLTQEIGKLIHLRYLDLSSNPIRELPETLCDLYNLQTLDLRKCFLLSALPQGIYKLVNLRHLLFQMGCMVSIPQGLERLTGLWILSCFIAARGSSKLGYLEKLNQLRGFLALHLGDLTELEDLDDAEKAELKNKIHIQELEFTFYGEVRLDIMEALQPPPNLHYLGMHGYKGTQLPLWITTSLNYLRVLNFSSFSNCSSLPPLGKLPMLEELKISSVHSMKCVGNEFLGIMGTIQNLPSAETAFPKLRKLSFIFCRNWEKWEDITGDEKDHLSIMPCLRELEIAECHKLKALPHCLLRMASSLEYLTVKYSSCLASLYGDRTGDEWDKISHIPHIKVESLEDIKRKRAPSQ